MSTQPFGPQGNTVAITVSGTSSTAVQVSSAQGAGLGAGNYMVTNIGTQTVFFTFIGPLKANGAKAVAGDCPACVAPIDGTPGNGVPVLANTQSSITLPPGAWVTTIAGTTGSTLYLTPGDGQ